MNRVIRRNWLSALVLASMTVFAGCAAETGDPEESAAGQEQAGNAAQEGDGEAVGTAKQADISVLNLNPGEHCAESSTVWLEKLIGDGLYDLAYPVECCKVFSGPHTTQTCGDICFYEGRCVGRY